MAGRRNTLITGQRVRTTDGGANGRPLHWDTLMALRERRKSSLTHFLLCLSPPLPPRCVATAVVDRLFYCRTVEKRTLEEAGTRGWGDEGTVWDKVRVRVTAGGEEEQGEGDVPQPLDPQHLLSLPSQPLCAQWVLSAVFSSTTENNKSLFPLSVCSLRNNCLLMTLITIYYIYYLLNHLEFVWANF